LLTYLFDAGRSETEKWLTLSPALAARLLSPHHVGHQLTRKPTLPSQPSP